jgi:hypothetical protein
VASDAHWVQLDTAATQAKVRHHSCVRKLGIGFCSNLFRAEQRSLGVGSSVVLLHPVANIVYLFPARAGRPLTTADVAKVLGVSGRLVSRQATKGLLPNFRIGTAVRYYLKQLARWLDGQ